MWLCEPAKMTIKTTITTKTLIFQMRESYSNTLKINNIFVLFSVLMLDNIQLKEGHLPWLPHLHRDFKNKHWKETGTDGLGIDDRFVIMSRDPFNSVDKQLKKKGTSVLEFLKYTIGTQKTCHYSWIVFKYWSKLSSEWIPCSSPEFLTWNRSSCGKS